MRTLQQLWNFLRLPRHSDSPLTEQPHESPISSSALRNVFTAIYHANAWGDGESRSGPGSTVVRTEPIRQVLREIVTRWNVQSLLDVPCGDFNWMKELSLPCRYIGIDIVEELILENRRLFAGPSREFHVGDLTRGPLPSVDLILCRDGLVHLSNAEILRALAVIKQSGSRLLLATSFDRQANEDILTGGWSPLALRAPPFSFPQPLELLSDGCPLADYADKALGLWAIADLPG
jgi:SAM-dependent methyltransferase